jgi:hypothetical protein
VAARRARGGRRDSPRDDQVAEIRAKVRAAHEEEET